MLSSHRLQLATSVLLSAALLSGCHSPERINASQATDSTLSCSQIQREISYAEQAKEAAREHDKFEMRYLLIVPAFVSAYNFDKAEKAANARKTNMEQLYASKNCGSQPQAQQSLPYVQPGTRGMGYQTIPGMEGTTQPPDVMPGDTYPEPMPYGMPPQVMPGR